MRYIAEIKIIIGNPYVEIPAKVLEHIFKEVGKSKGPIPVKGKLNNSTFKQTLVKYAGEWRLYLNGIMLKKAKLFTSGHISSVVGKIVDIEIEYDRISRKLPMHPGLKIALDKDEKARNSYEELPPYRKHEILRYLGFLKTKESIDLNIGRIIKHLRGEETDALYPLMHRKKKLQ